MSDEKSNKHIAIPAIGSFFGRLRQSKTGNAKQLTTSICYRYPRSFGKRRTFPSRKYAGANGDTGRQQYGGKQGFDRILFSVGKYRVLEASQRYNISIDKLRYYARNGLLSASPLPDGSADYAPGDLRRAGLIHSLLQAGRPDDLQVTLSTIMQDIIGDKSVDVAQGILHHGEGVDLLPSNIELSGLEIRLINAISRESVLKTCVNEVKKNYDYCLIDCMPSLGMLTINALAAADSVVIPYAAPLSFCQRLRAVALLRVESQTANQSSPAY